MWGFRTSAGAARRGEICKIKLGLMLQPTTRRQLGEQSGEQDHMSPGRDRNATVATAEPRSGNGK